MADRDDPRRDAGDEDEDEELDETDYKTVRDAVLFAIEVSPSMLKPTSSSEAKEPHRDSATIAALKCAYQLMQQRIISDPSSMMGILLFGTEKSKFEAGDDKKLSTQYPHCYLLSDLDKPSAQDVKRIRTLIEDENESKKLLVPSQEPVAMSNMLFCANQIFTTKAPNFSSRRLFLVTDGDDPHAGNKELKSAAVVRAKDLYDLGVTIELFPISTPYHDFETARFYDDIVYRPSSDPEAPAPIAKATSPSSSGDGISLLASLLTAIHSKIVPKRALFKNIPLELSPDLRISVTGYTMFKRQEPKKQGYVFLDGETPVIAEGTTNRVAEDTGKPLQHVEIRKAYKFGGELINFKPDELTDILNFGDPIIRLIGFKPLSMLPIWANMREATFIYPSEETYIGSTRTFSALQQTLVKKQRMGLAWYVARRNAAPVVAALIPGAERLGQQGEQLMPPGLWIVRLPFADDIRQYPEINGMIHAPDVLMDKMRPIIQQLHLPGTIFNPSVYPNPQLQWHYRILQAMALEEEIPEKSDDKTIPKYRQINKRCGGYIVEWGEELQAQYDKFRNEISATRPGSKRGAPELASSVPKKAKESSATPSIGPGEVLGDSEMRDRVNKNSVDKLTMVALKAWLKEKGQSINGKKGELVERVEGYFENKMILD